MGHNMGHRLRGVNFVGPKRVGQRRNCDIIWMARSGCVLKLTFLLTILISLHQAMAALNNRDANAMNAIRSALASSSSGWGNGDACTWTGVYCDKNNSTVERLLLANTSLSGTVPDQIGDLANLQMLDFSNNPSLTGPLPSSVGKLSNLTHLVLQYCSFNGQLPSEIGNLKLLEYLGVSYNMFSGPIPAKLGSNTKLTWLDLSSNNFNGSIPVSTTSNTLGLNNITDINHFHFSNNSLSGSVPAELFSPSLVNLIHVLLDSNELDGTFPNIPAFPPHLSILRVDNNHLNGTITTNWNSTTLIELRLNDNKFDGRLPNFSNLKNLTLLDASRNDFDATPFPSWATSLSNITTLNLASIRLNGSVPPAIFELESIQALNLSNNHLSGVLNFSGTTGENLGLIALSSNAITGINGNPSSTGVEISLQSNPICQNALFTSSSSCTTNISDCTNWQHPEKGLNSSCRGSTCTDDKDRNPYTCGCSYPLNLELLLTAPMFANLSSVTLSLEQELADMLALNKTQVYITTLACNSDGHVDVYVSIFPDPKDGDSLPENDKNNITQSLSHHVFNLKEGPYLLPFYWTSGLNAHKHGLKGSVIAAIVVGSVVGFLIFAGSLLFALYYKKRADKLAGSNPFASWGGGSAEFGEAPKLKGARWFSLSELKQYTDTWSDDFKIGEGGYGKVYRGQLPSGELVAIKRATAGSMQGANEFKNEIELLSRAHHRNLVGLVGFCYEGGEQALIYEFVSNGTLDDHLKGRADSPLTWDMRLDIATASARGIAYLHDHASPPIIHRDLKSTNILLNEKLVAKVADFGLSKLAPEEGEKIVYSMEVKGTLGYLDPEYYSTAILTDKSDIYSFGVVLLELLTARPPIDKGKYVVRDFRTALDRGGIEAVRPLMDPTIRDAVSTSDLQRYLKVVLPCVEEKGESRPTISEVVRGLEGLDELLSVQGGPDPEGGQGNGGGKKVKFSKEDPFVINEGDDNALNQKEGNFQYSGNYSTTVRPK